MEIRNGQIYLGDCLEVMAQIPDASIDLILCDLPYGTTSCAWDFIIPFEPLWAQYSRIVKPHSAIVLMASQPFTSALVMSNARHFKYSWVWNKRAVTGFANAKKQPLRHLEDVCIFAPRGTLNYFPQGLRVFNKERNNSPSVGGATLKGSHISNGKGSLRTPNLLRVQEFTNYPKQLLEIGRDAIKIHPTQKPVPLFEYLIRTYTSEGMTVLDNCLGSGTTAIAAERCGRRWVGIERDANYYDLALGRIFEGAEIHA
jgi:site-specific DNA-methyltransferase (adenine-specific)